MKYLNAVGGATLLDVLSEEEICKIVRLRIIQILKGQSGDIDIDESEDDDQLLEEDETEGEDFQEADSDDEHDIDIKEEGVSESGAAAADTTGQREEEKPRPTSPLNWFEEEEEEELPGPDFVTYGCWVRVHKERANTDVMYHIPLKDNKKTPWYDIMRKMLGQSKGFRMFIKGEYYVVTDFGRD